jgi:hypothetical protein
MVLQGLCSLHTGLAGRDAQVNHFARGKQRHALCAVAQFAPFEILLGDDDFALAVTRISRGGTDGIRGFDGEQQCFAVDDIERSQSFG